MNEFKNFNEITSKDNPYIKQYIKLRDQKKSRSELGLFVLEGSRIIQDAANEGVDIEYGFVTQEACVKYPEAVSSLSGRAKNGVFLIPETLSEKLSDTKVAQGVFCCSRTLDKILTADKIYNGGKYLVLNNLQDPGNVGTIIRVSDAVGLDGVYMCGCCDIYNPKTVRSTMGSLFRVPFSCDESYEDVINSLKSAGIVTYASVIDKDALSLRDTAFEKNCAVVIGNEGNGLTKDEALLCDKRITIKMSGNINSLNAASAAGIFLWELMK